MQISDKPTYNSSLGLNRVLMIYCSVLAFVATYWPLLIALIVVLMFLKSGLSSGFSDQHCFISVTVSACFGLDLRADGSVGL